VVRDESDADMFDENLDIEHHVEENDELASSKSNEENMQPLVVIAPDAPIDPVREANEANVPSSAVTLCDVPTSSHIDWGSYYTDEELMSYPVFISKPSTHRMHDPGSIISHIRAKVFTDNQIS
jgi:hypothetical protein